MIYVKRTFHPIGQGAFFTEQFFDKSQDKLLYNVVYDCGLKSSGIQKRMERTIRNSLHDKKVIDVLFLSHFDDDHVNYVMCLKSKGYLASTRIFIPMLAAEDWLEIEPFVSNYRLILSLNEQRQGGTKVIKVDFDKDEERLAENVVEPRTIEEIDEDTILSGTILRPAVSTTGPIWRYTPFNVQFKKLISDFKTQLRVEGLDYSQLTDKDYILSNMGKLKKIYQGLGKKPSGGTAINLNSLLVMSYPENPVNCEEISRRSLCDLFYYRWHQFEGRSAGSCLYTGDTSANEDFVWDRIEKMIEKCLGTKEKLLLIQIPHHGSKNSYDQKLLDTNRFYAGFTNYDPFYKQHVFDDNLVMRFALRRKPLILVTSEYASQYEEYWGVR